jgi:hypothetical protein
MGAALTVPEMRLSSQMRVKGNVGRHQFKVVGLRCHRKADGERQKNEGTEIALCRTPLPW